MTPESANICSQLLTLNVATRRDQNPAPAVRREAAAGVAENDGCGGNALRGQSALFRCGFRAFDFVGNSSAPLSPDSERAQVASTGALRIPDNRVCGGSGLGRSGARDLHTVDATHQR